MRLSGSTYQAINGFSGSIDYSGTDAATVFQNVFSALKSGSVYVGPYQFPFTKVVYISGSNMALDLDAGARIFRSGGGTHHLIYISGSTNCSIHGPGIIDGVADDTTEDRDDYNSNSIRVEDSNNVTIQGVYLDNPSDDGIYIIHCNKVRVLGNSVIDFYKHAIDVVSTSANDTSTDIVIAGNCVDAENGEIYDGITVYAYSPGGISIVNNVCRNVYNAAEADGTDESGIHVEDPSPTPNNNVITITGNTCIGCKHGITTATSRPVTITGNSIYNCTKRGIFLWHGKFTTVMGNVIETVPTGIYIDSGLNINLVGNNINNCSQYGIYGYYDSQGLWFSIINSNFISGSGINAILLSGSNNVNITSNVIMRTQQHGIRMISCIRNNITDNQVINSSQGGDGQYYSLSMEGVSTSHSYWNNIIGNHFACYTGVDVGAHINFNQFAGTGTVTLNKFDDDSVAVSEYPDTQLPNRIHNNQGYLTENWGNATVTPGTGSVAHGLDGACSRVFLTPSNYVGPLSWAASGSTGFYVYSTGSGDITLSWRAEM